MCVQHYRQYEDRVNNSEQCVQYNGAVAKALEFDNTHYDWTRRQEQGGWVSSAGSWISIAGREVASTDACVIQQAVGGRPPRYAPAPILPRGRRSASRGRADGNVAAISHGQHVPTPTAAAA